MMNEINKLSLNYTSCENCGKDYLVGINNKSTTGKGTHGTFEGTGYFAIGNEELTDEVKDKIPCINCGAMCEVKQAR